MLLGCSQARVTERNEELLMNCNYNIINNLNAPVKEYYWADQENMLNQIECNAKMDQLRNPD